PQTQERTAHQHYRRINDDRNILGRAGERARPRDVLRKNQVHHVDHFLHDGGQVESVDRATRWARVDGYRVISRCSNLFHAALRVKLPFGTPQRQWSFCAEATERCSHGWAWAARPNRARGRVRSRLGPQLPLSVSQRPPLVARVIGLQSVPWAPNPP